MNSFCRLCFSDKYVNNDIFDEDNALYLKMSLYLPIKVFKNDRLPQKICDRCSCKVNDFYQFCNAAIEVQNRLHAILLLTPNTVLDTIDLTGIKRGASPTPCKCEQSTQTEDDFSLTNEVTGTVEVKKEPVGSPKSPPREDEEVKRESDHFDDHHSDSSDDMSLLVLKNKKISENDVNCVDSNTKKKKAKYKNVGDILTSIPEDTALRVLPDNVKLEVKEESDDMELCRESMAKHETLKTDTYNCCVCLAQCYTKAEMLKHYRQHEEQCRASMQPPAVPPAPDQHPLRCPRCRKMLTGGAGEWEAHWVRHWARDRKPLRCAHCERSFADANAAFKHGLSHNLEEGDDQKDKQPNKRFVCDMCPQSFVYMRFLLAHRTREHPAEAARPLALRCGECAREFAHLNSLRRHIRAHTGERNYLCNVCGKALTSREHLKFHIRIHTGYKPNVCKTCGKGFVKKCNLTLHERVHSGEKPHVCSHCGKAFSQRSTLVIHERYHSGARPYVCGLCGRGFVAKGLLSMHLKTTCI